MGFTPTNAEQTELVHNHTHKVYKCVVNPNNRVDLFVMYFHQDGTITWEKLGSGLDMVRYYIEGGGYNVNPYANW